VLLIACANVANLSLSRAATREREMGIRTAIGGAPRRIARQLLTEHVLLSLAGAACGAVLAVPLLAVLVRVLPDETPRLAAVSLDWRALAFTVFVAVATGCAFGAAPVLHTLRLQLRAVLEAGGRSGGGAASGPVRKALAVGQIAAAALLVIAAGLLVRSLWALARVDPGFRVDGVVTARLSADASRCGDAARCLAFYRDVEAGLRAIPGVRAAALANGLPLTGAVAKRSLVVDGYTVPAGETAPLFRLNVVAPEYPRLMAMRLVAGRALTDADRAGAPVALVSAAAAARFWPGRDPIGRHVRFVGESRSRTIVGVLADVRAHDLTRDEPEWIDGTLYVPHGPDATLEDGQVPAEMTAVLETTLPAPAVEAQLRRLASERGGLLVDDVRPLASIVAAASAAPASTATLLGATAALALLLGSIGVYGVLSFLVSRRTRELGIRIALGAVPRDLCWVVLREGAALCLAGLAVGVAGALVVTRWLAAELHGVSARDPLTYAVVAIAMIVVTMAACLVPTARAMRVDPLTVLRST
jgi:predicted permease